MRRTVAIIIVASARQQLTAKIQVPNGPMNILSTNRNNILSTNHKNILSTNHRNILSTM